MYWIITNNPNDRMGFDTEKHANGYAEFLIRMGAVNVAIESR